MTRFILLILFVLSVTNLLIPQEKTQIIFEDNFSGYPDGSSGYPQWLAVKGNWQIVDGKYYQTSAEYDCASLLDTYVTSFVEFEVTFEQIDGDLGVGFIFSSRRRDGTQYSHMVRFDGSGVLLAGFFYNGEFTGTSSAKTPPVRMSESHTLILKIDPSLFLFSVMLDRQTILAEAPLKFPAGYIGLESSGGRVCFSRAVLRRTIESPPLNALTWIEHFAFHNDGRIAVPQEERGQVFVYDGQGKKISEIGTPAPERGQLRLPHSCAFADDSTLIITDRGGNSIHKFSVNGKWQGTSGWKGNGPGQFDDPQAVAVNEGGQIFIADRNNSRIQVFNRDLEPIAQFGADRLVSPVDICITDSTVCVLNNGLSQIEIFDWNGQKALWRKTIGYGGGDGRGIAAWKDRIYVCIFNEVRSYDTSGTRQKSFFGRSLNFVLPQSITADSRGRVFFADYNYGRIVCTDAGLLDPDPEISYEENGDVLIKWTSLEKSNGSLTYSDPSGKICAVREETSRYSHSVRLSLPAENITKYSCTFLPTLPAIPSISPEQPRYTFTTMPSNGTKLIARLPAVCLLFTNISDGNKPVPRDVSHDPLTETGIRRIEAQLEDGVKFYWIHSGMRLFIDLETIVINDPLKRNEVYGSEWWYPPIDTVLEKYLRANGKNIRDYSGVLYVTCTRQYDSISGQPVLSGGGGGFTSGVGTGKGYGISWWDATRAGHNAGNNWLMVHEFNHQLDDIFLASGYPEYWFNHISPTIGTAAGFGEHFDANSFIIQMVPCERWYDLAYTRLITAADSDNDGIPDNDPRLPLDEYRLNSDPTEADSDHDGVPDMAELLRSNWITEGWGETYGGDACFPRLDESDSDNDGISDLHDPLPCLPFPGIVRFSDKDTAYLLTELHDKMINALVSASWNSDSLRFVVDTDSLTPIKLMIDGNNDGWFMGRENLLITLTPGNDLTLNARLQIFNATDPAKWPFMDKNLPGTALISSSAVKTPTGFRIKLNVGRNDKLNLLYASGKQVGLLIGFLRDFDAGSRRYINIHEPNRFFRAELR